MKFPHETRGHPQSLNVFIEINQERLTLSEAVEKYGKVCYKTVMTRIHRDNWEPIEAIVTPKLKLIRI